MRIYQVTFKETIHWEPPALAPGEIRGILNTPTDTPRQEMRYIGVDGGVLEAHAKALASIAARTWDTPGTSAKDVEIISIALHMEAE